MQEESMWKETLELGENIDQGLTKKLAYEEAYSLYIYMYDWIDAEIIIHKSRIFLSSYAGRLTAREPNRP